MAQKNWTREQTIVALSTYFNIPFNKANNSNVEIQKTAKIIGRSINSVKMKIGNFGSLDPELKKRGIVGLTGASTLDKEIWKEYSIDKEKLAFDSTSLIAKFSDKPIEEIIEIPETDLPLGLEKLQEVKVRINQYFFRKNILGIYDNKCCITSLSIPQLLVASHIVPWSKDKTNRMNPENGLCLNAIHDKAFDNGLITITKDYCVKLSSALNDYHLDKFAAKFFKSFENKKINLPERYFPNSDFLDYHNEHIFKK